MGYFHYKEMYLQYRGKVEQLCRRGLYRAIFSGAPHCLLIPNFSINTLLDLAPRQIFGFCGVIILVTK